MFEDAKLQPTTNKRVESVRNEVMEAHRKGTLFITKLLMEDEPYRSLAFHACDGKVLDNATVHAVRDGLALENVRLVSVSPGAAKDTHIRYKVWESARIAGTDKYQEGWRWVDAGTDATLPHKVARFVLRNNGWPVVQHKSNGGRTGGVVEYEWLRWEAARPDATEEVRELWARVGEKSPPPKDKQRAERPTT